MSLPRSEPHGPSDEAVIAAPRSFWPTRWFLRRLLDRVATGSLHVVTPDGDSWHGGQHASPLRATLILKNWRAVRRLLLDGDIGLAEAYRDGDFETPDLTALIELGASNDEALRAMMSGIPFNRYVNRWRHLLNANSRTGSRRNIVAHYDLGNAFYGHWLDQGMAYSSALYAEPDDTLEIAQARKLDAVVKMLDLRGGEHVLEIGCGWGGLAERLAREGCKVTAVTLSPSQLAYTRERLANAGLSDRVDAQLLDYRDIRGRFDRIVSIEMIEAVGHAFWPGYFAGLRSALKPGGRIVLQAITIDERVFGSYLAGTDFIQRYIFPGGCLPSRSAIEQHATAVRLALTDELTFGASYARTLREWRQRFQMRWNEIATLGFDMRFRRLWEFYLCYCEAGFRAGNTDVRLLALAPAESS